MQAVSYRMDYFIEKEGGFYQLRIKEYKNNKLERTEMVYHLTEDLQEAKKIRKLLEENQVFICHIPEVLESFGFSPECGERKKEAVDVCF